MNVHQTLKPLIGAALCAALSFAPAAAQEAPATPPGPETVAERTSFAEVTRQLDANGNLFAYISAEASLRTLDTFIEGLIPAIDGALARNAHNPDFQDRGKAVVTLLHHAYRESGLRDLSGVGISSVAVGRNFYRNRLVVHHWPENNKGKLWSMFGTAPHELQGLSFLPPTTVWAGFRDLDLKLLWDWQKDLVMRSGSSTLIADYQRGIEEMKKTIDIERLIGSTAGEVGFILTLNPEHMVNVPAGGQVIAFPEPGLVLAIRVMDDALIRFIEGYLQQRQLPIAKQAFGDVQASVLAMQLPLPFTLQPSFAMMDGYLLMATSPTLFGEVIAARRGTGPRLVDTPEFKRMADQIELKGNMFAFADPRFAKAISDLQKATVAGSEGAAELMAALGGLQKPENDWSFGVVQVRPDGLVCTGNGGTSGAEGVVTVATVMPGAVLAGLLTPAIARATWKFNPPTKQGKESQP